MPKVESNAAIEALEKKKMNAAHWCVASLAIGLVGGMAPVFLMPWDDPWSTVVLGIFVITMMIGLIGNAVRIVKYDLQQKMCRVDMAKGASRRNAAPNEMVLRTAFCATASGGRGKCASCGSKPMTWRRTTGARKSRNSVSRRA